MKLTIKDIAKLANVSTATVSRVINNVDLNKVGKETRNRVLKVIDENKYHPDIAGFSLATGRKNMLGLMIPAENFNTYSYYFSEILRGIVRATNEFSFKIILLTWEIKGEEAYKNIIRSKSIDGLIFIGSEINDRRIYELIEEKIPFILVNNYLQNTDINFIDSNNKKGAYEATKYLINLGHKKIAFIKGPDVSQNAVDRYNGFIEAMEESKIPINNDFIRIGNFNSVTTFQVVSEMFEFSNNLPTAIFAADDTMAIASLEAIRQKGLKVPDDISLVGFNNSPETTLVTPRLTTVDQFIFLIGYEAAKMLISIVKKAEKIGNHQIIDTKLIIRESCKEVNFGQ